MKRFGSKDSTSVHLKLSYLAFCVCRGSGPYKYWLKVILSHVVITSVFCRNDTLERLHDVLILGKILSS
jgi:hypothetical protein